MNTRMLQAVLLCLSIQFIAAKSSASELSITSASISEINRAMDKGEVSSEFLVNSLLQRIEAFDKNGPAINSILYLNANALEQARSLDLERQTQGRRSPLHGIPVLLKDNIDTQDMPTTAGSFLLKNSFPADDAQVVRKLKAAGAIVLGKLNMSEFASGGPLSSLGGLIQNPHHLSKTPSGSSGGTGAAIAAKFAFAGLGTDTGGSVRGPSAANGIVGLKTTHGLVSTDGVIPLALTFDTVGPMTTSVEDLALVMNVIAEPQSSTIDYAISLQKQGLKGKKIGVLRAFTGDDYSVDWLFDAAIETIKKQGAEVVDVELPKWLMDARGHFYRAIRFPEFKAQIADYLATLGDEFPKSLEQIIELSMQVNAKQDNGVIPNPGRWSLMTVENKATGLDGYEYQVVKQHALPLLRATLEGLMQSNELDALVYPTSSQPAEFIDSPHPPGSLPGTNGANFNLANISGFPDLSLPIGFTELGLPVNISFMGKAYSEPTLIEMAYSLEQQLNAIRLPKHTPAL